MTQHRIGSDKTIKALKPPTKRISDGKGLHLRVSPVGGKHWYQDTCHQGAKFTLSLGSYPEVGLAMARELSRQLRTLAASGVDLYEMRREEKRKNKERIAAARLLGTEPAAADSFQCVALDWYEGQRKNWSESHASKVLVRMKKHLFTSLGNRQISQLRTADITKVVMDIDSRGNSETAARVLEICRRVFDYGRATGKVSMNPCEFIKEVLRTPQGKHHAAITEPKKLVAFIERVNGYEGSVQVRSALQLALMTFLRSSELRWAKWEEIDLEGKSWWVPASRMKQTKREKLNGMPHLVPLSDQAIKVLQQLKAVSNSTAYVFPGQGWKQPVISENTINKAIRCMGLCTQRDMTMHGVRATARTILVERMGWQSELVDMQLHHQVLDANGRAYNRAEFEFERRQMMQEWSDYLDSVGSGVVPDQVRFHTKSLANFVATQIAATTQLKREGGQE